MSLILVFEGVFFFKVLIVLNLSFIGVTSVKDNSWHDIHMRRVKRDMTLYTLVVHNIWPLLEAHAHGLQSPWCFLKGFLKNCFEGLMVCFNRDI